ncbi:MAG: CAP domain-containing protein [Roseobacter sp.]
MKHLIRAVLLLVCLATAAAASPKATKALNDFRASQGRSTVTYSETLHAAALTHARDMVSGRFFSHTGSDGSDIAQRVSRTGYGWCRVAENIAQGQADLAEVMTDWANSPGHRANMLLEDVTEFALVRELGNTWVMVLARSGC